MSSSVRCAHQNGGNAAGRSPACFRRNHFGRTTWGGVKPGVGSVHRERSAASRAPVLAVASDDKLREVKLEDHRRWTQCPHQRPPVWRVHPVMRTHRHHHQSGRPRRSAGARGLCLLFIDRRARHGNPPMARPRQLSVRFIPFDKRDRSRHPGRTRVARVIDRDGNPGAMEIRARRVGGRRNYGLVLLPACRARWTQRVRYTVIATIGGRTTSASPGPNGLATAPFLFFIHNPPYQHFPLPDVVRRSDHALFLHLLDQLRRTVVPDVQMPLDE
jgi:hypothetical protein